MLGHLYAAHLVNELVADFGMGNGIGSIQIGGILSHHLHVIESQGGDIVQIRGYKLGDFGGDRNAAGTVDEEVGGFIVGPVVDVGGRLVAHSMQLISLKVR